MFFQSRSWLEEREENIRLREIVLELRERLLKAGLPTDVPSKPPEEDDSQMILALFNYDTLPEKVSKS
jgi:hypothetical protein